MSDKSQRYIGLVIWVFIILVFWFFDEGDFWGYDQDSIIRMRLEVTFDPSNSPALVIVEQFVRYNFSGSNSYSITVAGIFWLVSLPIALYSAWWFRAAPASLIIKLGRAFHRSV
jgi:hypothetical protein